VGEEGLELALASVAQDDTAVIAEAADLLYHVTLLLETKGLSLAQVVDELAARGAGGGGADGSSGSGSGG
jgi:phosphoribosyl-ATP pyrophosphohydrolase